ncbi:MAG: hypothetical protein ACFCUI_03000 [Bernardetiaceae bacterium]
MNISKSLKAAFFVGLTLLSCTASAQRLFDVQDLMQLFTIRNEEALDKALNQFANWYYISSEQKPNGDQVDLWMLERPNHEVIGVVLRLTHPQEQSPKHNQLQLHLKNEDEFVRLLNQARDLGFGKQADKAVSGSVATSYYQNDTYQLVAQVSATWKLPFRLMLTLR